jgi:hypothetical protein
MAPIIEERRERENAAKRQMQEAPPLAGLPVLSQLFAELDLALSLLSALLAAALLAALTGLLLLLAGFRIATLLLLTGLRLVLLRILLRVLVRIARIFVCHSLSFQWNTRPTLVNAERAPLFPPRNFTRRTNASGAHRFHSCLYSRP